VKHAHFLRLYTVVIAKDVVKCDTETTMKSQNVKHTPAEYFRPVTVIMQTVSFSIVPRMLSVNRTHYIFKTPFSSVAFVDIFVCCEFMCLRTVCCFQDSCHRGLDVSSDTPGVTSTTQTNAITVLDR